MKKILSLTSAFLMAVSSTVVSVHAESEMFDMEYPLSVIHEEAEKYIEENNLALKVISTEETEKELPFIVIYRENNKNMADENSLASYLLENCMFNYYFTTDEEVMEKLILLPQINAKLKTYIKENNIDAWTISPEDGEAWLSSPDYVPCVYMDYSSQYAWKKDNQLTAFMEENGIDSSLVTFEWDMGGFSEDAETILSSGDATGDGDVNILDVISLNKAVMGKETLTEAQLQTIDFNQNGKPDPDEALILLKYIVGLIEDFTA